MVGLEELSKLPKQVDLRLEDCHFIADNSKERSDVYKVTLAEKDGHYYMFEENHRTKAELGDLTEILSEKEDTRYNEVCVREISLNRKTEGFDKSIDFYYTSDDKHIRYISANYETGICVRPDVFKLRDDQIKEGDSCTYKGITITYKNENNIAIEKDGMCREMPVEKDTNFTYKFMKSKIKAINGAKGIYKHFEQIAEQAKIDLPIFRDGFKIAANAALFDTKRPPFSIENPKIQKALPPYRYTMVVYTKDKGFSSDQYSDLGKAIADGRKCIEYGHKGFAVTQISNNKDLEMVEGIFPVNMYYPNANYYSLVTNLDGEIDEKKEYVDLDEALEAGDEFLKEGYNGYAVLNRGNKQIEAIAGDMPISKTFNKEILEANNMYFPEAEQAEEISERDIIDD